MQQKQMSDYFSLGFRGAKAYQAIGITFSLLFLLLAFLLEASVDFIAFYLAIAFFINLFYYLFANIKYSANEFVIEKFLWHKTIPTSEFIEVKKLFFNLYKIQFVSSNHYFKGSVKSIFEDGDKITNEIRENLKELAKNQ